MIDIGDSVVVSIKGEIIGIYLTGIKETKRWVTVSIETHEGFSRTINVPLDTVKQEKN